MNFLLGIDIGTSSVKTLIIDEFGKAICSSSEEYPFEIPRQGWAEQDPEYWWKAVISTIRNVLSNSGIAPRDISGIGLSGQMHGTVFLDGKGDILRPCLLWCDQRTIKECDHITSTIGKDRLIREAGNPALTGFSAGKILWVRNNEPDLFQKTCMILLPKDFIRFRLTGNFATEVSDASGTLLLNIRKRAWSDLILNALDIPKQILPDCFESTQITGTISKEAAKLTGLLEGTPVVGGGGDQAAQAIGCGAVETGVISITIGTSGVVFACMDEPKIDNEGRLHTFCHAIPGKWHTMGVMLSAGGALKWFSDTLCKDEKHFATKNEKNVFKHLSTLTKSIPVGSQGCIFLPYLSGERSPHLDPYARGVFFGLSLIHTRNHMLRAVMEGVGYGLRNSFEILKDLGIPISQVRLSGGGSESKEWTEIITDIINFETCTVGTSHGASYGAAILAGVGTKIFKTIEEACRMSIRTSSVREPVIINAELHNSFYKIYNDLYGALKKSFKNIHSVLEQ